MTQGVIYNHLVSILFWEIHFQNTIFHVREKVKVVTDLTSISSYPNLKVPWVRNTVSVSPSEYFKSLKP